MITAKFPHLLICFALIYVCSSASFAQQKHKDLIEFGLNGPVKSVVTLKYDSTGFDSSFKIKSALDWKFKNEYYFNPSGNLDSIIWSGYYPYSDSLFYTKRIFNYSQNVKTALDFDATGTLTDSLTYLWENDSTYVITQYTLDKNEKIISRHKLSSSFRDKSAVTEIYQNDSLILLEEYENRVDKNNRTVSSHSHDKLNDERKSISYEHLDLDRHRNTSRIIQRNEDTEAITLIMMRKIEYY